MSFASLIIPALICYAIIYYYQKNLYELSFEEAPKRKIRYMLAAMGIVLVVGYSITFYFGLKMVLEGWDIIFQKPDSVLMVIASPFPFAWGLKHCKNAIKFTDTELVEYMDSQAYDPRPTGY